MDQRVQELVEHTQEKFGLKNYYLERYHFYRSINFLNETVYTLTMEWFPNHADQEEDDSNPEGTACVEIDLNNRKFSNAIFVMGKSYAEDGVKFSQFNKEEIITWIEDETKLKYGKQFRLESEEQGELTFIACIDGIAVSPTGTINVKFDQEGKLTLFSIHGHFPSTDLIKKEKYTLTFEQLEDLKKEQIRLIESPSYEQKRFFPIYAIEEIFVTNDGNKTIPFEFFADKSNLLKLNHIIYWDSPISEPFIRKEISWIEDLNVEQAFSCKPSPDSFPITKEEQEKCKTAVKTLLRQEYPDESGSWILKHLYRDKGFIQATLKAKKQDNRVFQRKIKIFIDPRSFHVLNYMDSKLMLDTFEDFQASDEVTITKEEAYKKLSKYFELKPYYVFDFQKKQYVLCGKFDCHYGVNASNGEVRALNDW